jgi:hypothetical protein
MAPIWVLLNGNGEGLATIPPGSSARPATPTWDLAHQTQNTWPTDGADSGVAFATFITRTYGNMTATILVGAMQRSFRGLLRAFGNRGHCNNK